MTPVKIKNQKLGQYMPKGKKEFVSSVQNYALIIVSRGGPLLTNIALMQVSFI